MKNEKSKYTPGPWIVMTERPWIVIMPEKSDIGPGNKYASVGGGNNEANARLIAAAPELLAALENALAEIEAGMDEGYPTVKAVKEQARAAIAKAKGE